MKLQWTPTFSTKRLGYIGWFFINDPENKKGHNLFLVWLLSVQLTGSIGPLWIELELMEATFLTRSQRTKTKMRNSLGAKRFNDMLIFRHRLRKSLVRSNIASGWSESKLNLVKVDFGIGWNISEAGSAVTTSASQARKTFVNSWWA